MPRPLGPVVVPLVLFLLAGICVGLLALEPFLLPARPPPADLPLTTATVEYSEPFRDPGPIVGLPLRHTIITDLRITHPKEIRESETAVISVQVEQFEHITQLSSRQPPAHWTDSGARALDALANPVTMSLETNDFDIAADKDGKPGNERLLRKGAPVPVTLGWTPTPRRSGETSLLLRLKNISSASVRINGEPVTASGADDLALHINVLTEFGISRYWYRLIVVVFGALFGAGGLFATLILLRGAKNSGA